MRLTLRVRNKLQAGQVLPMFGLLLMVLFLFTALGIDLGFAYITKANLSKAVDAAALAAMRNLSQGQSQAASIGQTAFTTNYKASNLDASPPVANFVFSKDANNNTLLNVTATATINTFFIRILPQWKTLTITAAAQSTRANLIMSIVLDRSGSMNFNGGAQALPPAVTSFVNDFDDNNDRVAMISFSTIPTVDVPIGAQPGNFKGPITNAVSVMKFKGGTFSTGGLTNAQAQNDSVAVAPGQNVVKVVVFFTDGWANMNEDTLSCAPTKLIYGGCAPPEAAIGWCGGVFFMDTTGNQHPGGCNSATFPAQQPGNQGRLTPVPSGELDISNDAMYRSVQVSNAVRSEAVPMQVFSVGLGDKINQVFLQQVANDPASPTFDSSKPQGLALFVPTCPSATCTSDLQQAFQSIAAQILLRLTQ